MFSNLPNPLPLALRSPRTLTALAVGALTVAGVTWYTLRRPRPSAEELERDRRNLLSAVGRITDGTITDASFDPEDPTRTPPLIIYEYRIGGVTYECAQDVTILADHVRDIRTDLPIQVRYDLHNPGNSIVVSESWSGLRHAQHPRPDNPAQTPAHAADQHS